jgi:nitrogen fixation NifU-like protein
MSDTLTDLYQDVVLDHCRHPRHRGALEHPTHSAEGDNPLCGDRVRVELELCGEKILDAAFSGEGCAISTASASLLMDSLVGRSVADARTLIDQFRASLVEGTPGDPEILGANAAMLGVRAYPMRVKCATLAWHTTLAALAAPAGSSLLELDSPQ